MIINGKEYDYKSDIALGSYNLEYSSHIRYLGVLISDSGNLTSDIKDYVYSKQSEATIKL